MSETRKTRTVAVDLDDTILDFDWETWLDNPFSYYGPPQEGAKKALQKLRKLGFRIIIHSCRLTPGKFRHNMSLLEVLIELSNWLVKHKIPFDELWAKKGKPMADFYVDNHGIRHTNWTDTIAQITGILSEDSYE